MANDVKEYVKTCPACLAASPRNPAPPMELMETPVGPWRHCAADFKGPIAIQGGIYLHVLIDTYTRWPEVEVVKSTSLHHLKPALERSFALHGVPETIRHDNGPTYQSHDWKRFAKEKGFKSQPVTPEHPEGNGIAE